MLYILADYIHRSFPLRYDYIVFKCINHYINYYSVTSKWS